MGLRRLMVLVVLLVGCATASRSWSAEKQLNLFIWSEYIDPQVVAEFEKRFQCRVVIDLYEDDAAMTAKLQRGGDSVYDVVVPSDQQVPALIHLKLLAPLRAENIPNLRHLDGKFKSLPYDPGNIYTVPYQWGTLGIYARKKPGTDLPPTWGLIFDRKLQPGPVVLIDSARDLIGAALLFKGHEINASEPRHLKDARDLILQAKSRAIAFDGSVGAKNKVLTGVAAAAIVYSGEAVRGIKEDPQTTYIIPKEGSEIWVDNLAIPAKAPHRELAEAFINFLLEPEIGARISNYTQFATPNASARRFVNPADLSNPAIYPPPEVMEKLHFLKQLGAKRRLYDEVWTQIKSR